MQATVGGFAVVAVATGVRVALQIAAVVASAVVKKEAPAERVRLFHAEERAKKANLRLWEGYSEEQEAAAKAAAAEAAAAEAEPVPDSQKQTVQLMLTEIVGGLQKASTRVGGLGAHIGGIGEQIGGHRNTPIP